MEFYIKAQPDSNEFKVEENNFYNFYLTQPAKDGQANSELIRRLTDILGVKPGIISGHHSRRKKIKADITEEEFENKMRSMING